MKIRMGTADHSPYLLVRFSFRLMSKTSALRRLLNICGVKHWTDATQAKTTAAAHGSTKIRIRDSPRIRVKIVRGHKVTRGRYKFQNYVFSLILNMNLCTPYSIRGNLATRCIELQIILSRFRFDLCPRPAPFGAFSTPAV